MVSSSCFLRQSFPLLFLLSQYYIFKKIFLGSYLFNFLDIKYFSHPPFHLPSHFTTISLLPPLFPLLSSPLFLLTKGHIFYGGPPPQSPAFNLEIKTLFLV